MSDFARQQAEFQRGILDGDDAVLAEILDSPQEKREVLFGVYRYAYGSRLVEAMRNDHELLHLYLGDEMFDEMGRAYVKAHPKVKVKLLGFDERGKVRLSMKVVDQQTGEDLEAKRSAEGEQQREAVGSE